MNLKWQVRLQWVVLLLVIALAAAPASRQIDIQSVDGSHRVTIKPEGIWIIRDGVTRAVLTTTGNGGQLKLSVPETGTFTGSFEDGLMFGSTADAFPDLKGVNINVR